MNSMRDRILGQVDDSVSDLLYYDRKDDEELPRGAIEQAVRDGVVSVDEMVAKFDECLRRVIPARSVVDNG